MKIILQQNEFADIAKNIQENIKKLAKKYDINLGQSDFLFGPEFLAQPLRVFTPSTKYEFDPHQLAYVSGLRQKIIEDKSIQDEAIRKAKLQHLESIVLFGQLLFAQAASLYFLKKLTKPADKLQVLENLINAEEIENNTSRLDTLKRRKQFNENWKAIERSIKDSEMAEQEKLALLEHLKKVRGFYYQANDLNFRYANALSRGSFSQFLRNYELYGSRLNLGISLLAMAFTAASIACPAMALPALVLSSIALGVGLPIYLKHMCTMIYNAVRFGVEPTPAEIVSSALLVTNVALVGSADAIGQALNASLSDDKAATLVSKGITASHSVTKMGVNGSRQLDRLSQNRASSWFNGARQTLQEIRKSGKEEEAPNPGTP